jgi:2-polyprenyl-3-methyl-5-hydroxy-6-metoxy-1,4-benzoquinol methylase
MTILLAATSQQQSMQQPVLQQLQQPGRPDAEPWKVRQRWYEQRKRNLLLACLPQQRYRRAFEPGCGNGELAAALAQRAERVLASDLSIEAIGLTRRRLLQEPLSDSSRVTIRQQRMPQDWPHGETFDLIVINEMAYYLEDAQALMQLRAHCAASLADGGTLVLCHWRRDLPGRKLNTDSIHTVFGAAPGLQPLMHHEEEDFLLDIWSNSETSVAQREGLA